MAGFSINESKFVVDMEDEFFERLHDKELLPVSIVVGEKRDEGEKFSLYISEDGAFDILAADNDLADRWVAEGYLPERALLSHVCERSGKSCKLLITPASGVLCRLTDVRVCGSSHYAYLVASAFRHVRAVDPEINLRDAVFCEHYGVLLPTFSLTPKIADVSLFANTLRGRYDEEDLRSPSDFPDGTGALSPFAFAECMKKAGIAFNPVEPLFYAGECIDGVISLDRDGVCITGVLENNEHYQIFSTDTDLKVLALSDSLAKKLFELRLILQMDYRPVMAGHDRFWVKAYRRSFALENLNNRHFGITQRELLDLAVACGRMCKAVPEASLSNALYIQEEGKVLPVCFDGRNEGSDLALLREIAEYGPFAQGAFMHDITDAALSVYKALS